MRKSLATLLLASLFLVGCNGEPGPQGPKGDQGDQGEKGQTGVQGDKGETGDDGERGETGERGEKGQQGIPGDRGEQGDQGIKGEKGPTGEKGPVGHTPVLTISDDGYWVVDGEKTNMPATGLKGPDGQPGDAGDPGTKGAVGDDTEYYNVTFVATINGYVYCTKSDYKLAEEVVFIAVPDQGYTVDHIEVNGTSHDFTYSEETSLYTYTTNMPQNGLVIRGVFKANA